MVPRWRSLAVTLQSGELATPIKGNVARPELIVQPLELLSRLEKWQLSPSLLTAAELVEICIVEGRELDAVDAARRLVSLDKNAAPLIREQAAKLLTRTGHVRDISPELKSSLKATSGARVMTRVHPHDPMAWVELALEQTIRGSGAAAERSMLVALQLAPHNRHVLRAASRLYLHRDDPDRAFATIAKNAATRGDPWLIASEVALAQVADRTSRFLKHGSNMLSDRHFHPRQITELAGAIATEELVHGNRKKSKRWFTQSLEDPTGSALAQGEWATSAFGGGGLVSEARLNSTFENDEARAYHLFRMRRFQQVREACDRWSDNDPFSVRPFEFGATAAGIVEDFEVSLAFAKRGLGIRPTLPNLLNAEAFAAASLGRTEEAAAALDKINTNDAPKVQQLIALANRGLVAFRSGDEVTGRVFYARAVDGFRGDGALEMAARAKVYLAREAMLIGATDWQDLLKEAQSAMEKFKDSEATASLKIVEKMASNLRDSVPVSEKQQSSYSANAPRVNMNVTFHMRPLPPTDTDLKF